MIVNKNTYIVRVVRSDRTASTLGPDMRASRRPRPANDQPRAPTQTRKATFDADRAPRICTPTRSRRVDPPQTGSRRDRERRRTARALPGGPSQPGSGGREDKKKERGLNLRPFGRLRVGEDEEALQAPGGACPSKGRRLSGSRAVEPGYFSQPLNVALDQPSPECAGARPSGLPP
jgi:hypothetical protein